MIWIQLARLGLVPGITVCYDIKHFNPAKQKLVEADVSLVPYKGRTLAAGTGWVHLNAEQDPRTVEPTFEEVNELLTELYQDGSVIGNGR